MQNYLMAGETMVPTGRLGRRHMVSTQRVLLRLHHICGYHSSYALAEPDAGIVNFYQTKDTLMGHVDRSEICATSPLVSIS
jgi:alkylated DNA repair dioxygenase AlkB